MTTSNDSKVSFSMQSKLNPNKSTKPKSSSSSTHRHEDHRITSTAKQFISEFDPNQTHNDSKHQSRIIIPRKSDQSHTPSKKMKNLDVVLSEKTNASERLQFEEEKNHEAKSEVENIVYGLNVRVKKVDNSEAEPVLVESNSSEPNSGGLLKDVKVDMHSLPDDEGFNEFDEMPVEEFGAALLRGLGWYKGRGVGRNPKGDVEIKQVEKKSFVSDDVVIASKDRELNGFSVEKTMNMKVNSKSKYEDRDRKSKREDRFRDDDNGRSRESERREKREKRDEKRVGWLRSYIRVRVISKELKRGRFYLKKGRVVDVVGPNTCDISMDEGGELVQGVDQDFLETALPKRGGPVLVLFGEHKGVYGNLVNKDLDRETGVVRNADNHELLNVKLEQIAEYVGDPSDIGY